MKTDRKEYNRAWRKANVEKIREYSRVWRKEHAERVSKHNRAYRAKHPEIHRACSIRYERNNRDKKLARCKAKNAVISGKLERQPCEICGDSNSVMHHDDYSQPLSVKHFCLKHHQAHHNSKRYANKPNNNQKA